MISGLMNQSIIGTRAVGVVAPNIGASDWEELVGDMTNFTKIGGDKHYFTTIPHFNSASQVGKSYIPTRTNQSFALGQLEADVYTLTASWSVDQITQARIDQVLANTGAGGSTIGYMQALARQGISQRLRLMGLFGLESGEGIISGSKSVDLGDDPDGNSTIKKQNPDWLAKQLADFISDIESNMLNTASEIVILTSNEIYNALHYKRSATQNTIFDGSVVSIADYLTRVVEGTGRKLIIGKDPILAKADSTKVKDLIVIVAPGITEESAKGNPDLNVNSFGLEVKNIPYNTCMDVGQRTEKIYPESYAGMNGDIKCSATAGVVLRAGVSIVIKAQYQ